MAKEVFDGDSASSMVKELRETFRTGKTKNYEWRISQLKSLLKVAENHEREIVDVLRSDISKPEFESFVHEVCFFHEDSVFFFWFVLDYRNHTVYLCDADMLIVQFQFLMNCELIELVLSWMVELFGLFHAVMLWLLKRIDFDFL